MLGQIFDCPVMAPGCAGTREIETERLCAGLLPQLLSAVTVTEPLLLPAVVRIELDEDDPLQPDGSVHV